MSSGVRCTRVVQVCGQVERGNFLVRFLCDFRSEISVHNRKLSRYIYSKCSPPSMQSQVQLHFAKMASSGEISSIYGVVCATAEKFSTIKARAITPQSVVALRCELQVPTII